MKRFLAVFLVLVMVFTQIPFSAFADDLEFEEFEEFEDFDAAPSSGSKRPGASEESEKSKEPEFSFAGFTVTEDEEGNKVLEYPDELLVGHPTTLRGDFFTEMFGNDTADIDVRALIHAYNLVSWDQNQGVYVFDPTIVTDVRAVEDADGNRTYYIVLAEDLYYSDGSHITAWDYAFSLLLMMAPEIEEIGGKIYRAEHILGYDDYILGKFPSLTGVEVLDDYQLAITLDHEFLPYFFEVGLLLCVPYPISVIAPGCKVYDDGYGVYIGNEDKNNPEPIFTAELLRKTILDPETGYNTHPSVVSGPYVLTAYDGVTAHFEINPYFKGAWEEPFVNGGEEPDEVDEEEREELDPDALEAAEESSLIKPSIEKISFTVADNDTMKQQLIDGELHLVNKVVYGPTIMDMMQTAGQTGLRFQNYPRIGLAFLTFTYDWPTVNDMKVRQAIAWCMDRQQLMQDYTKGFGMVVNGYHGIEQWEYLLVTGAIDYPVNMLADVIQPGQKESDLTKFAYRYARTDAEYDSMIEAWEQLTLDNLVDYEVDTDKANALLDEEGWTLNREGQPYRKGIDEVRCKMIDGELVALDLTMMYPEGNHIIDTIQENFIDNLNEVGILLTLVPTPMLDLFRSYYREEERTTDMIYLATNFHVVVDPAITYSADDEATHLMWNNTYSDDQELYDDAVDMRKTEPGDVYNYVRKWVKFQERYNEVLPTIPVYSNIYFDFYNPYLQNYYITAHVTWTQAILEAIWGLDEEPEPEEDLEDEEFDEGEFEDGEFEEFDDF